MRQKIIKRHCEKCKKDVESSTSDAVIVMGDIYYPSLRYPDCGTDLSKEDKKAILKAKLKGDDSSVIMF